MKNDVWEKAERIFHAALDLPAKDRNLYLQQECADDVALFSEVESLLSSFEENSDFLDEPIFEKGLEVLEVNKSKPEKSLSGLVIGHYELQEKIGAGGMGEVYKAIDTRLNRRVALKFLSESLENDHAARRRFLKEAQAVAMLDHSNICAVHGIEQSDEHHFIVMQYIEGKTLAESINCESVTAERFKSLARQIIGAVAFAHSHGIIHRDLKPGNIMLTNEGQIKVLDFGLAKIISQKQILEDNSTEDVSQFSQSGLVIGTVSYMSPEQLRGEKLDYRTDIFSLGIILYELLYRENPFHRKSQAETIAAILSDQSTSLKKNTPYFHENLVNLVEKCLQKNKEQRFQSAAEMLIELDKIESTNTRQLFSKRYKGFLVKATFAVFVLLTIWAGIFFYLEKPQQKTLAVLPISLDNQLTEKDYLAYGLTQSLIDKLSNLSGLKVKNESIVAHYKGESFDPQAVGKELNVDAVYTGSIIKRGDALILTTKLIRTSDGFIIDKDEQNIDETNLIQLEENISSRIINKIESNLTSDDRNKLAKKDTENPEAKLSYLRGLDYFEKQEGDDLKNAEKCFRDSTKLDPTYAKAWTGLANTYSLFNVPGYKGSRSPDEGIILARAAAKKAIDIDDTLCEPYVSMGMIKLRYDWDWSGAENYFRAAINRNPEFPQAHLGLSNLLIIKGEFAKSIEEAKKGKELSPFSVLPDLSLARTYYFERNYEQMDKVLSESLKNFPNHKRLNYLRGLLYLETGKLQEATEIFEKIYQEDNIYGAAPLGLVYGKTGRKSETQKIIDNLESLSKKDGEDYISSQEMAILYLGLGDSDKVFEYLNKSCQEKFSAFPFVITDPIFDEIKSDPGFQDLKKCANL
ncbi:MAG TPA: protein kinase [Pyrinomonadaceae bacterium]|jgi:serine/threonine protein kinase